MPGVTRSIPEDYSHQRTLDFENNRRLLIGANVLVTILLLVFGAAIIIATNHLRPDLNWNTVIDSMTSTPLVLAALIPLFAVTIIIHEAIHGVCFWYYTRTRPVFDLTIHSASAGAPDWYLQRNPFIVIIAAPVVVITLAGLLLIVILPAYLLGYAQAAVILNGASATGDIMVLAWLATYPATALFNDSGSTMSAYIKL